MSSRASTPRVKSSKSLTRRQSQLPVLQGVLRKRHKGLFHATWEPFWFNLEGDRLCYYSSIHHFEHDGLIPLRKITTIESLNAPVHSYDRFPDANTSKFVDNTDDLANSGSRKDERSSSPAVDRPDLAFSPQVQELKHIAASVPLPRSGSPSSQRSGTPDSTPAPIHHNPIFDKPPSEGEKKYLICIEMETGERSLRALGLSSSEDTRRKVFLMAGDMLQRDAWVKGIFAWRKYYVKEFERTQKYKRAGLPKNRKKFFDSSQSAGDLHSLTPSSVGRSHRGYVYNTKSKRWEKENRSGRTTGSAITRRGDSQSKLTQPSSSDSTSQSSSSYVLASPKPTSGPVRHLDERVGDRVHSPRPSEERSSHSSSSGHISLSGSAGSSSRRLEQSEDSSSSSSHGRRILEDSGERTSDSYTGTPDQHTSLQHYPRVFSSVLADIDELQRRVRELETVLLPPELALSRSKPMTPAEVETTRQSLESLSPRSRLEKEHALWQVERTLHLEVQRLREHQLSQTKHKLDMLRKQAMQVIESKDLEISNLQQEFFYSIALSVKFELASMGKTVNAVDVQTLFEQVKKEELSWTEWPRWLRMKIIALSEPGGSTASAPSTEESSAADSLASSSRRVVSTPMAVSASKRVSAQKPIPRRRGTLGEGTLPQF